MSKAAFKSIDLSIRTEKILKDLICHKGDLEYCYRIIKEMSEDEAKGVLKHFFYSK